MCSWNWEKLEFVYMEFLTLILKKDIDSTSEKSENVFSFFENLFLVYFLFHLKYVFGHVQNMGKA